MIEKLTYPPVDVTAGLAERRVSLVDFPWRNLPVGEFGEAIISLVEIGLEDGPDAAAALARAFEGAEVMCECDLRLDAETITQLNALLTTLRDAAVAHPMLAANVWLLWGIDAFRTTVECSQPRDELLLYLRPARLSLECFCAGQQLAARHGGQASMLHSSAHAVN